MKKLFILFVFIFAFLLSPSNVLGQVQEPTPGTLTSSQVNKTTYDKFLPLSINVYFAPSGFDASTADAAIGIGAYDTVSAVDPTTGFRKFLLKSSANLLSGSLGDLKRKLNAARLAGKITEQEETIYLGKLLQFYLDVNTLLKDTQTILEKAEIVKIEPIQIKE